MSEKKEVIKKALKAIKSVQSLIYQRNQAYAFIAMRGLAHDFLAFIEQKQCERITNEELKMILKTYTRKKK